MRSSPRVDTKGSTCYRCPRIFGRMRGNVKGMGDSRETGRTRSDDKRKKQSKRSPRNTLLYIGSVVILVLVVVTFVGVPAAGGFAQQQGSIVFGRYDGEDIAYRPGNFFARQYEIIAQSLRDSSDDLDLEIQLRIAWRQAFNRTVFRTAVLREAARSNMRVSEDRVDELIARDPRFMRDGRFDVSAYRNIGNQERFALRTFHRETAKYERFLQDALEGSHSPEAERRFVAAMAGPERSFTLVRFPFDDFPIQQVSAYAAENSDLFTGLTLSAITLATREEAEQIRGRALQPGNPFSELARTYSRDLYADRGGEIGEVWGHEIQQELLDPENLSAVVGLQADEISLPLETTSGWTLYRADEPPIGFDPDDTDALREVRSYMQAFEQGRIQDFVREEARSFAVRARGSGLSAAAVEEDREILETPYFPINFGNSQLFTRLNAPAIPDLADAANRQDFFVQAFSLEEGEVSDPVVLRRSALVLQLRDERPADDQQMDFLAEYYDSIKAQLQSEEIESVYLDEDRLEDNFLASFNRYVLGIR